MWNIAPCCLTIDPLSHCLIDTSDEVSFSPVSRNHKVTPQTLKLATADSLLFHICDYRQENISLGLWWSFFWRSFRGYQHSYLRCRVSVPLWIANEIHNRFLTDPITSIRSSGPRRSKPLLAFLKGVANSCILALLWKYRSIATECSFSKPVKDVIQHHPNTTGFPIFSKVRPLPEKHAVTRKEFMVLLKEGFANLQTVVGRHFPWSLKPVANEDLLANINV